ncbi:MAG: branched-chain amino acid aminotransferase, partial [Angustibacter sp.]
AQTRPYGPFQLDPSAAVLHYAQEVFEGLRAYRHQDGSVWAFRPELNAERFRRSARRLALPELPVGDFLASLRALAKADEPWVPAADDGEKNLYLRPFMFAQEAFLGVRPARAVTYAVIASPAGAYFPSGVQPVSIWLSEEFTRAAPGGTGAAKCGGNYAAGLTAQVEASAAGCAQVCYLDAAERRWVEELGGMNLFFVHADGSVQTPPTSGTILEGVTRNSVIELLRARGITVREEPMDIHDWQKKARSGELVEVFACGTAAVITPVGRLVWAGGEVSMSGGRSGELTIQLRAELLDLQYGRRPAPPGWLYQLA